MGIKDLDPPNYSGAPQKELEEGGDTSVLSLSQDDNVGRDLEEPEEVWRGQLGVLVSNKRGQNLDSGGRDGADWVKLRLGDKIKGLDTHLDMGAEKEKHTKISGYGSVVVCKTLPPPTPTYPHLFTCLFILSILVEKVWVGVSEAAEHDNYGHAEKNPCLYGPSPVIF